MAETVEKAGFELESIPEGRGNELARNIREVLKSGQLGSGPRQKRRESSRGGRLNGEQEAGKWDDEFAFIQAEEPDDARWDFDDSVDTDKSKPPVPGEVAWNGDSKAANGAESADGAVTPLQSEAPPVAKAPWSGRVCSPASDAALPEPAEPDFTHGMAETSDQIMARRLAARGGLDIEPEGPEQVSEEWESDRLEDDWHRPGRQKDEGDETALEQEGYEPLANFGEFVDIPTEGFEADSDEEELKWSRSRWIDHEEYSQAIALDIARSVGWGEAGMQVIAWAIRPYRNFGRVRADLKILIRAERVTVRELRLATELRSAWVDGGYNRGWVYTRNHFGTRAVDCKINLDWWLALKMYRVLGAEDVEEVRLFLDHFFEAWTEMSATVADVDLGLMDPASVEKRAVMHFHEYLHLVLDRMAQADGERRMPPFVDPHLFPREEGIRDCDTDGLDFCEALPSHE